MHAVVGADSTVMHVGDLVDEDSMDGLNDRESDGRRVGIAVGVLVIDRVGASEDGTSVGIDVGHIVGKFEGTPVGNCVDGLFVGRNVGASVGIYVYPLSVGD